MNLGCVEPQKKPCWNCGHPVGQEDVICENCGMGLLIEDDKTEETTIDELDALIEGKNDLSLGSLNEELDSLLTEEDDLDLNDFLIETPDENNTTQITDHPTTAESSQDFTVTEKSLPQMLEKISEVSEAEPQEDQDVFVAHPEPSFTMPAIPSFEEIETETETEPESSMVEVVAHPINGKRIFLSTFGQFVYWYFVFLLIGVLTVDITDPNVLIPDIPILYNLGFDVIRISEHLYFGVGLFLPMGWFFRYKLNQWGVNPSVGKGITFLVLQLLVHSLFTYGLLLLNPGVIFSLYIIAAWFVHLISLFIGGMLTYFMGYKFLFKVIYETTPASKLQDLESVS